MPEYFWFHPFTGELAGFTLQRGVYVPIAPDEHDRLISERLELALVRWTGTYQGISARWLRWATLAGDMLATEHEAAAAARQQAEQARREAEAAQRRVGELERLISRYRERYGDVEE